jgi:hypothetical protein
MSSVRAEAAGTHSAFDRGKDPVGSEPSRDIATGSAPAVAATDRGVVTRYITVELAGSLTNLASGGQAAKWAVAQNADAIFQPSTTDRGYSDLAGNCDLNSAVLHTMEVETVQSSFPCAVGVNITGVSGQSTSREGHKYAMIVTSDTRWSGAKKLVEVDDMTNNEYLLKYPGMTPDKIGSAGIVNVPNESYVFVDQKHPIIEMLNVNAEALQVNMSEADLIDGRWYKVESQVVNDCAELLDKQLLQHLPIINLKDFTVTAERLGKVPWDRLETDGLAGDRDALVERMMQKTNRLTVQLKVQYRFM